jgi:hypothetical protein
MHRDLARGVETGLYLVGDVSDPLLGVGLA